MASFDIVNRIDLQEVDNAVNITKKTIQSRYDFRESKTEIMLDKKDKKINVTTEDEMKMRAVQETLVENLVKRKVDTRVLGIQAKRNGSTGDDPKGDHDQGRGGFRYCPGDCQNDQRSEDEGSSGDTGKAGSSHGQKD